MGDLSEFFKRDLKIRGKALKAIEFSERAIAVVAGIETVVGAVNVVVDLINLTNTARDHNDELILEFRAVTATAESVVLMREVELQINEARTQASVVRTFLPGELNSESERGLVLNISQQVVRKLGSSSFWLRPYFVEGTYHDHWSGALLPDVVELATRTNAVFDWRLTLPAYLEAIAIRLMVLSALVDNYRVRHRDELLEMAERLEGFYQQIMGGIRMHRAPEAYELRATITTPALWSHANLTRLFGAVEVHSTANSVVAYPDDPDIDYFLLNFQLVPSDRYSRFLARHTVKSLGQWKVLYNELGLPAICRVIGHLRRLAGRPSQDNVLGHWSIREVERVLSNATRTSDLEPDGRLRVNALLARLGNSTSIRQSFES